MIAERMRGTMPISGADYRALVNHWYAMPFATDGRDKSELRTVAEMLLPAYVNAVTDGGMPILDMSDPMLWTIENRELRGYLVDRTGYAGTTVDNFLLVLDDAVSRGALPAKYLNPEVWEDVAPPTLIEQFFDSPIAASAGDMIGGQFTKVLIAAGVVTVAVLLGKAAIQRL